MSEDGVQPGGRRVSNGSHRHARNRSRVPREIVYGIHAAAEALQHPEQVVAAWAVRYDTANRRLQELIGHALELGISVQQASSHALDRISGGGVHQGIVLELRGQAPHSWQEFRALPEELAVHGEQALLVLLDGVSDPRNVGAVLRCALGAGAHALAVPRDRSAALTPAARKCASGADRHLPFYALPNLARALDTLRVQGVRILGLDALAPIAIYDEDLTSPLALVLGSEAQGLRSLTRTKCDALVAIPADPRLASLNVACAAAIALFEVRRQRHSYC